MALELLRNAPIVGRVKKLGVFHPQQTVRSHMVSTHMHRGFDLCGFLRLAVGRSGWAQAHGGTGLHALWGMGRVPEWVPWGTVSRHDQGTGGEPSTGVLVRAHGGPRGLLRQYFLKPFPFAGTWRWNC